MTVLFFRPKSLGQMFQMCTFTLSVEPQVTQSAINLFGPQKRTPILMLVPPLSLIWMFNSLSRHLISPNMLIKPGFPPRFSVGKPFKSHVKDAKSTTWLPTLVWSMDPQHSTRLRMVINLLHCCCGCWYANIECFREMLRVFRKWSGHIKKLFYSFKSQHFSVNRDAPILLFPDISSIIEIFDPIPMLSEQPGWLSASFRASRVLCSYTRVVRQHNMHSWHKVHLFCLEMSNLIRYQSSVSEHSLKLIPVFASLPFRNEQKSLIHMHFPL